MDIVIMEPSMRVNKLFEIVHIRLLKVKAFEYVEAIYAKVPILKLKDNKTGLAVDVAFNRDDGIRGCLFSSLSIQLFPELRPLYCVLKAFLRERKLDSTRDGGICSFMLLNMITFFLQQQYKLGRI